MTVTSTAAMINHRIRFFAISFNSLPSEACYPQPTQACFA
jgi:hypothetical protein